MGCSDSKHQKQAEEVFFEEQRRARIASTIAVSRDGTKPRKTGSDLAEQISRSKKQSPSALLLEDAKELSSLVKELPTLPGSVTSIVGPSGKSTTQSGGLNVGAVFRAALEEQCEVALTPETLPHIVDRILKALDKDSNGCIELADLRRFVLGMCRTASLETSPDAQAPPDEQVAEVFAQLDLDRSGAISRPELAAVLFRWFIVGVC